MCPVCADNNNNNKTLIHDSRLIWIFIRRFNVAGTLLVSSSMDKTIKLWDLQGNCLKTLAEHTRYVNDLAINSDSSVLASGSNDRRVIIWDLTDELTLDSHLAGVRSLLFNLASRSSEIPVEYICPITHEVMKNPATAEGASTHFIPQLESLRSQYISVSVFFFRRFHLRTIGHRRMVQPRKNHIAND